ncbi:MAG: TIGR04255 family protein [Lewinellaceae bacterium]|nr:TIGR04255 family protein [Lewinellaceae bacterium]
MPVLAKITPDYLRDTIVEVRYEAELPYEILKGLLYKELVDDFQLLSEINPLGVLHLGPQQQLKLGGSNALDFTDEKIKIRVHEERIIFNSLDAYPGWKDYFPVIKRVLDRLNKAGYIKRFSRVGIRYISEFQNILIFDHLRMDLNFAFTGQHAHNTSVRTELIENGARVVLNLVNNAKRTPPHQDDFFSIIDIDVIGEPSQQANMEEFFEHIDQLHSVEKDFFVRILKKEFLDTLNPEYE